MQQILALEIFLKLIPGVLLLVVPRTCCRALGMPRDEFGFWPRLFGALLVGIGVAAIVEWRGMNGISVATLVVVNFSGAAAILSALFLKRASKTWRGRAVLFIGACLLVVLGLFEIPYL